MKINIVCNTVVEIMVKDIKLMKINNILFNVKIFYFDNGLKSSFDIFINKNKYLQLL